MKIFYKLIKLDLVLEECENIFFTRYFHELQLFYLGSPCSDVSLVYFWNFWRILGAWRYFDGLKLYLLFVEFVFELKAWFETTFNYCMDPDSWFSKFRDQDDTP